MFIHLVIRISAIDIQVNQAKNQNKTDDEKPIREHISPVGWNTCVLFRLMYTD